MKASDIKRLERALEHLNKAEDLIDKTEESVYTQPNEYLTNDPGSMSTYYAIKEIREGVSNERFWLEHRLSAFKRL